MICQACGDTPYPSLERAFQPPVGAGSARESASRMAVFAGRARSYRGCEVVIKSQLPRGGEGVKVETGHTAPAWPLGSLSTDCLRDQGTACSGRRRRIGPPPHPAPSPGGGTAACRRLNRPLPLGGEGWGEGVNFPPMAPCRIRARNAVQMDQERRPHPGERGAPLLYHSRSPWEPSRDFLG